MLQTKGLHVSCRHGGPQALESVAFCLGLQNLRHPSQIFDNHYQSPESTVRMSFDGQITSFESVILSSGYNMYENELVYGHKYFHSTHSLNIL